LKKLRLIFGGQRQRSGLKKSSGGGGKAKAVPRMLRIECAQCLFKRRILVKQSLATMIPNLSPGHFVPILPLRIKHLNMINTAKYHKKLKVQ